MTDLPLHPSIVHVPLGLAVVAPVLFASALTAWARGALPRRAWWLAVLVQFVLAASAFGALRTGEAEEERVGHALPHDAIHVHEERAETFLIAVFLVLGAAVSAGLLKPNRAALWVGGATTLGAVVALGLGVRAGHAGGALVWLHGAVSVELPAAHDD